MFIKIRQALLNFKFVYVPGVIIFMVAMKEQQQIGRILLWYNHNILEEEKDAMDVYHKSDRDCCNANAIR